MIEESEALREGILAAARLMVVSAITAPKARGVDNVRARILERPEEIEMLAKAMEEMAAELGEFYARDAISVRRSAAVVIVGCKIVDFGLKSMEGLRVGLNEALSLVNLGIALGSAVRAAAELGVDNRIMLTAGNAALRLGLIDADFALGVPLSATSKSVFFDRRWPPR
ncbi:MAG: DUF2148 domain-containing protein [Fervidicoccaceae archaeon]